MSLKYRKDRMASLACHWNGYLVRPLFMEWKIPHKLLTNLELAVGQYIAQAMGFPFTTDEKQFILQINNNRNNRKNITPNGGVTPKKEYQLEYNLFLKAWCDIVRTMISVNPVLLKKFRLTPNIRIKFSSELEENIGRGLDTALPHSDAWVEGPWGMNCHVPLFGDTQNNYLQFFCLRDEEKFDDSFLHISATYTEMQWVMNYYEIDRKVIPKKGCVNVSDYALIHNTHRNPGCDTRVSIDTTIFVGDHDVHPDRSNEYLDAIPVIGEELFVMCLKGENDHFSEKQSIFTHYTIGNIKHVHLES